MDPGRAPRRPGEADSYGPAGGTGLPHQGPAGHRPSRRGLCRRRAAGLRLRRRGLRFVHRATHVLRRPESGLRAAGPLQLPAGAGQRGHADLQASRRPAGQHAQLGDPLRWGGIEGATLVRLGMDCYRLCPASSADPPPPDHRRAGLSLLLLARGPAGIGVPAGPRGRAQMAGGGGPPVVQIKSCSSFIAGLLLGGSPVWLAGSSGRGCRSLPGGLFARGAAASGRRLR
jgi:hypothetical protein